MANKFNHHAHLRWFILDQECRGIGVGKLLLSKALAFCQAQQFDAVELWTFKGLNAAIKLYDQSGFQLEKEEKGSQWGAPVIEQHYIKNYFIDITILRSE
ncbi:ribosomal protein S18 acetylase RimI-like enzyme [Providencia alcalifaciens]|nr:ribosomal protein S18 acetylase RimI-like enzyme [Providencia alcalifaciens]